MKQEDEAFERPKDIDLQSEAIINEEPTSPQNKMPQKMVQTQIIVTKKQIVCFTLILLMITCTMSVILYEVIDSGHREEMQDIQQKLDKIEQQNGKEEKQELAEVQQEDQEEEQELVEDQEENQELESPLYQNTNCKDIEKFIKFSKSYNVKKALNHSHFLSSKKHEDGYRVNFVCDDLFLAKPGSSISSPPKLEEIKKTKKGYLQDLRLQDSDIKVIDQYFNETYNPKNVAFWSRKKVDEQFILNRSVCYNNPDCNTTIWRYQHLIKNKIGAVIGSQSPWAESLLLYYGAAHVTTIEYQRIKTDHPKLSIYTPSQISKKYINNTLSKQDFVFTYSSIENDGLGSYGEPLNAFADLETIGRIHCMLNENGVLFLGIPVGSDLIAFNSHRVYGYKRMSIILSMGFQLIDLIYSKPFQIDHYNTKWGIHPIFVLKKVSNH